MGTREILAGSAVVAVGVKDQMKKGLASIGNRLDKFGRRVTAIGSTLMRGGGLLAGFSTAAMAPVLAAARHFSALGDQVQKMGIRTQASASWLSEMKFAAEQSGSSIDQLGNGLFRMNRRIANAATETGPAVRALEELGLSAERMSQLTTEQRLDVIADALNSMTNQSRAAQLGFELFGDSFKALQPLLAEGASGMAKLRGEANALGITMSQEDADAAAEFADAQNRLSKTASAAWRNIGAAVAPVLTRVANLVAGVVSIVADWIDNNRGLFLSILGILSAVATIGGTIATAGLGMAIMGTAISAIVSVLAVLAKIAAAVAMPLLIVGAVLGGAAALAYIFRDAIFAALAPLKPILDGVIEQFSIFGEIFKTTFGGIVQALSSGDLQQAGRIAMQGLQAVWHQGLLSLAGFAQRFLGSVGQAIIGGRWDLAFQIVWERIKLVFRQGWNSVHAIWLGARQLIGGAWDSFVLGMTSVWRTAYFGIARGFVFIANQALSMVRKLAPAIEALGFESLAKNLNSMSLDGVDGMLKQMQEEALQRDRRAIGARGKARDAELSKALESDRLAEKSALARIAMLEKEAAANDQGLAGLEAKAAAAKADLQKVVADASTKVDEKTNSESIDKLRQAVSVGSNATRAASSTGSFSAAAALAISAGSSSERAANETARNTRTISKLLQKQNKKMGHGGLKIA